MEVEFIDADLERLEIDPGASAGRGQAVDRGFRKVMQAIRAAQDERDLYNSRGLRFENLKGRRKHQYSLRINDQWRLIVEFQGKADQKMVLIVSIEDHH